MKLISRHTTSVVYALIAVAATATSRMAYAETASSGTTFRLAILGDSPWSAGALRPSLQAIAAANGQALEILEIPAKGRPLEQVVQNLVRTANSQQSGRWDAVVVFDHPTRLLVQRRTSELGDHLETLSQVASQVIWVLTPGRRITPAVEAERVSLLMAVGPYPSLRVVSVTRALQRLYELASGVRWVVDLQADRVTSMGDYLVATLICAALWQIKQLPKEVPIGAGASLIVPSEALPLLAQLAGELHGGGLVAPRLDFDYAPELAEPEQLASPKGPAQFDNTGLIASVYDWNDDGRLDLILSAEQTGRCQLWVPSPAGPTYELAQEWGPSGGPSPWESLLNEQVTVFQVLDFDRNRRPDFLVGTSSGTLAIIRQKPEGLFGPVEVFKAARGDPLRVPYLSSAFLGMLDHDPIWTLVVGNQMGEVIFFKQDPSDSVSWKGPTPLQIADLDFQTEGAVTASFADWDRDGRTDLVIGTQQGSVLWIRNVTANQVPVWDLPVTLISPVAEGATLIPYRSRQANDPWAPRPGWNLRPVAADLNGDHLPDLIVGDSNRRGVKYRELTPAEEAEIQTLLKQRESLLSKLNRVAGNEESAIRAALWELTLALLEKSRERRYERCGWVWYFERRSLAEPRP